jgi:hypothetical protein
MFDSRCSMFDHALCLTSVDSPAFLRGRQSTAAVNSSSSSRCVWLQQYGMCAVLGESACAVSAVTTNNIKKRQLAILVLFCCTQEGAAALAAQQTLPLPLHHSSPSVLSGACTTTTPLASG